MSIETTTGFPNLTADFNDSYSIISITGWILPSASGDDMTTWIKSQEYEFRVVGDDGVDMRMQYFSDHTGGGANDGVYDSSDDSIQIGVPAHVAVCHDRGTPGDATIYINGVADTTIIEAAAGNARTSNRVHGIFNNFNGSTPFFGRMADLRLYNRVLSAAEIAAIAFGRGGDDIVDYVSRVMCDEQEPGNGVGAGDIVDLGQAAVWTPNGTLIYQDDPFGLSARNSRSIAS